VEDFGMKEKTLRDVLRVFFRHKLIVITVFITMMVSVYLATELRTPRYEAYVKILVSGKMQKDLEVQRELGPGSLVETQMELLKSRPIIERTVKALKLYAIPLDYEKRFATRLKAALIDRQVKKLKRELENMTPEQRQAFLFNKALGELSGKISTYRVGEGSVFMIAAQDFSPVGAAVIANVISRSYVIFDIEQQIAELQLTYGEKNLTIKKLEQHIERLKETLDGRVLSDVEALGPASVKIVAQATWGSPLPMRPSQPAALIIGFIMSVVSSFVLAFGFEYFNQTFKSPQDIERFLNIPFLGSIPKIKSKDKLLSIVDNPLTTNKYIQSFQLLSNQLTLFLKDKNLKSVLITDAEDSKGMGVVVATLGTYLAKKLGRKVLIIDANLRFPSMSKIFNIADIPGLTDVLEGKSLFEYVVQDLGGNLYVLPTSDTVLNPVTLLDSSVMPDVIKKAEEQYEIVFVGCASLKNFTDAVIVSSITDGTVLVINEGKVRRQVIKNAIAPLEQRKANIIGAILNNRTYPIPGIIYKIT